MARTFSKATRDSLNTMADMLSREVPVQEAGEELGYSRGGSQALFLRIRRELGWQAK
jgi:hypothetical protein